MLSSYLLGAKVGKANPRLLEQVMAAMRFALSQQLRADSMFRVPPQVNGLGAISGSPIDRAVRIDYVQHVCSAMIRSSELLQSMADRDKTPKSDRIQ
jgi:hypothetical protein